MTGRSTIDADRLRQLYSVDKATVDEIAAEFDRDRRAIYDALHREGIPLRGRHDQQSWSEVLTADYLAWCMSRGWSDYRIAAEVGASSPTVTEWRARHGLGDSFTTEQRKRAHQWYTDEGCTIDEVARRAKIGKRSAKRLLLEAGVELRPRGRRSRT